MSDPLRSSSIPSSNRSAFSRRRFVTLQLTDLPLTGSSSIPSISTEDSTASFLSVEPSSVGSLPVELPSFELPSLEPSPAEPPSAASSSQISLSGRFSLAEYSLTTSSSPGPRLLEPRSFGTRLNGPPVAGPDYQLSNGANPEVYHIDVKTFSTTSPCIVFNLPAFGYDASDILAVIGKVSGVGGFDSDTCRHCAETWEMCTTPSTLKIFSEGTEGVLGTHVTLFLKSKEPTGLCAVIGRTQDFLLGELGTSDHALIVSSYVSTMVNRLSDFTGGSEYLEPDSHCKMVFIKCPRGCNSDESKRSRYASAWGACQGLLEFPLRGLEGDLPKMRSEINMGFWRTWSKKAYCVSSIEREDCGLLMIATNSRTNGNLRAISAVMTNPIDVKPTQDALKKIKEDGGYLIQVFATVDPNKAGAGGVEISNEQISSAFYAMNNDPIMSGDQHARAAVGSILAALCENTNIYVSSGGDGQGPWGGGNLCFIYKIDSQMNDIPAAWTELDIEIDLDEAGMNIIALPEVNNELNTMAIPEINSGLNTLTVPEVSSEPKHKRPRME